MFRLFHGGLTNIAVIPATFIMDYAMADQACDFKMMVEVATQAGVVSEEEGARWLESLEEARLSGCFFRAITGFIVSGQRP